MDSLLHLPGVHRKGRFVYVATRFAVYQREAVLYTILIEITSPFPTTVLTFLTGNMCMLIVKVLE